MCSRFFHVQNWVFLPSLAELNLYGGGGGGDSLQTTRLCSSKTHSYGHVGHTFRDYKRSRRQCQWHKLDTREMWWRSCFQGRCSISLLFHLLGLSAGWVHVSLTVTLATSCNVFHQMCWKCAGMTVKSRSILELADRLWCAHHVLYLSKDAGQQIQWRKHGDHTALKLPRLNWTEKRHQTKDKVYCLYAQNWPVPMNMMSKGCNQFCDYTSCFAVFIF